MNIYTLLMIIPVVLAVALIIMIVRRNITENTGRSIDIAPAIPAVVVLMIAILVIAPMAESTQDYIFDEKSGELSINKNIAQAEIQPWDDYADEVKSLVIKDNLTIGSGAFDSLTSLDYLKIGEGVTLGSGVFGVTLANSLGTSAAAGPGEYVGLGDGTLYLCDDSIFTYNSTLNAITGFASGYESSVAVVLPREHNSVPVTAVSSGAFQNSATIEALLSVPDSNVTSILDSAFYQCTALEIAMLPDSLTGIGPSVFRGCAALASVDFPDTLKTLGGNAFNGCSALKAIALPNLTQIGGSCFDYCTAVETLSIESGGNVQAFSFNRFTSITSVTFGKDFGTTSLHVNWTNMVFYESDGTTAIDKTVASNLAGKTFEGTTAALVEVIPGERSLTPDQLTKVQLHTQELQRQELDIDPLPFQPSVQTQDQEPVSA